MEEKIRLDKYLSESGRYSRGDAKKLISSGCVVCGGVTVKDAAFKLSRDEIITVSGREYSAEKFVYIMLNKPKGVVSASEGKGDVTVVDILPENFKRRGLFPAGRLDRDTTGFCLITNDGAFAHRILAPSSHVSKTYLVTLEKPLDLASAVAAFENGIVLSDGTHLCPAELSPVTGGEHTVLEVTLHEGKYHQIKRMFQSLGNCVTELKRVSIGGVLLDLSLAEGECRYLTSGEVEIIDKNTIVQNHEP